MADPITVEFELAADEVSDALGIRSERTSSFYLVGLMLVGDRVVCYVLYDGGHRPKMWIPAALFLAYAVATLFYALVYLPRRRKIEAKRLCGAVRVQLADDGVRYGAANTAKGFSLAEGEQRDRAWPAVWVITAGKKRDGYVIPKSAVPEGQLDTVALQLKEWSGKAYKVRKR